MGPGPGELYRFTLARCVLESKFIDWFIQLSEDVTYFDLLLLLKWLFDANPTLKLSSTMEWEIDFYFLADIPLSFYYVCGVLGMKGLLLFDEL